MKKKNILVFTNYYEPGFRGGGPIRSIKNLTSSLSDDFNFYIFTSNTDLGSNVCYENITVNTWLEIDGIKIFYSNESFRTSKNINYILNQINYDVIYLNSFFCFDFTIKPLLLIKKEKNNILLAPRGEFSIGALSIKKFKKMMFLLLCKYINPYNSIYWHASNNKEKQDIIRVSKKFKLIKNHEKKLLEAQVISAPDLITLRDIIKSNNNKKFEGILKIIFISRICKKKNLDFALKVLSMINIPVVFNIYGPVEDVQYWSYCKSLISNLPNNISVKYFGELKHDQVCNVLCDSNILLFPTLGENYGHVIVESWQSGVPVIISDETPWRDLASKNLGYDISLNDIYGYINAINSYASLSQEGFNNVSSICKKFASSLSNSDSIKLNKELFNNIIKTNTD